MRSTGKQVRHLQRFLERFNQGYHLALVNKKTDKIASSNNWQLSLAALAYQSGDHSGIVSLLPQSKAKDLLQDNKLKNKKRRGEKSNLASRIAREQAKLFIPTLASFYLGYAGCLMLGWSPCHAKRPWVHALANPSGHLC